MRIHFVTNACMEILAKDTRILCDPWLVPGAFDGSWWQNPPLRLKPQDFTEYTHLYISHIHQDHCDTYTLKQLPNKDVPVIILKNPDGFVRKRVASCGFKNFIELENGESVTISNGVIVTMYSAFAANPFIDIGVPNIIDSSIVVSDGTHTFLNINDNTPDAAACAMLVKRHGYVDASTVPYSGVGPFPSSYLNLSEEEKKEACIQKQEQYLNRMVEVANILKAKVFLPAAGQMILGGKQMYKNSTLGVVDQKIGVERLTAAGHKAAFLEEGDFFDIGTMEHTKTLPESKWSDTSLKKLEQARYWWEDAFDIHESERAPLIPLLQSARERLSKYQEKYNFWTDWTLAIRVLEEPDFVYTFSYADTSSVSKARTTDLLQGGSKFLMVEVPYNYLIAILTRHCHWNNAYHGCQVNWWRQPDEYVPELQMLLSFFHL